MNRLVSTVFVLLATTVLWASAEAFQRFADDGDIPEWARASVDTVQERKIMTGFGDGSFRPRQQLNRAEALVLLMRAKGIEVETTSQSQDTGFRDVPRRAWFSGAVYEAVNREWIKGFPDGTFRPEKTLNRAEWATLVMRAFAMERQENPGFKDVPSRAWFAQPIFALAANELIREKNENFRPGDAGSRADAAWMIAQILRKPRLTGESQENDFEAAGYRRANDRRVAIKPRDFNAYKQGYDIQKKELNMSAQAKTGVVAVRREDPDWQDIGSVRIKNDLDDRVELHSFEMKLRFERSNVGPTDAFQVQVRGGGVNGEVDVSQSGNVFVGGLTLVIMPGDEAVFRVGIKADPEGIFFFNRGLGVLSLHQADASMISTFQRDNPDRTGNFRSAPISFGDRKLTTIEFRP